MTQHDHPPDTDLRAPNQSGRGLRWTVRLLFLACGLMMGAVLLSQPRVLSHVQAGADRIVGIMTPNAEPQDLTAALPSQDSIAAEKLLQAVPMENAEYPAAPAQNTAASGPGEKPRISTMPGNQVPVRRAGVLKGG